ncbi:MAG: hypothetical protein ACR2LC_16935 [Pyrinomonadaceae bacterium]
MRLKLYCNRFAHFKDALVCSVNCVYRTRCRDFALYYDEHRADVDALVANYFAERAAPPKPASPVKTRASLPPPIAADMRALIRLEVKREMAEPAYIWISKDDQAELLELDEVIKRAEHGAKAKHIFKVAQEMELRFQLVPRKRIDKAKRIANAEAEREQGRAAARRTRNLQSVEAPALVSSVAPIDSVAPQTAAPTPRRTRRPRAAKAVGE